MDAAKKLADGGRRLKLNKKERAAVLEVLSSYLNDKNRSIRMFSMQALANLAIDEARLRPQVITLLEDLTKTGSPAIQNAGRKLLASLNQL
jgi:hypothetical protein